MKINLCAAFINALTNDSFLIAVGAILGGLVFGLGAAALSLPTGAAIALGTVLAGTTALVQATGSYLPKRTEAAPALA